MGTSGSVPAQLPSSRRSGLILVASACALGAVASAVLYKRRKGKATRLEELSKVWARITQSISEHGGAEEEVLAISAQEFCDSVLQGLVGEEERGGEALKSIFLGQKGRDVQIEFADWAFLEALLTADSDKLGLALRLFSANDGTLQAADLRKAFKGALSMDLTLATRFWEQHLSEEGRIDGAKILRWKSDLEHFLRRGKFMQSARVDDPEKLSSITAASFAKIITSRGGSNVPRFVKSNINSLPSVFFDRISDQDYLQFQSFVHSLPRVSRALVMCSQRGRISRPDFEKALKMGGGIVLPPHVVALLFHVFNDPDALGMMDLATMMDIVTKPALELHFAGGLHGAGDLELPTSAGLLHHTAMIAKSFSLGGIAGAAGATFVFPLDVAKSRLQNQRTMLNATSPSSVRYTGALDCLRKTFKNEGFRGLYRGLGPQLVGVAPEKALKLVVNDVLRSAFSKKSGGSDELETSTIDLPMEILAGAGAGASQVLVTNPLEITKLRMQLMGEVSPAVRKSAFAIVQELGFSGLYKGSSACFLRDIPFSMIYFPSYSALKKYFCDENGKNSAESLLLSGTMAGGLAAFTVTPADVCKTRLQAEARAGQTGYTGLVDCAVKIYEMEGPAAFFKGAMLRVFRSGPQFGVTLLAYELLHDFFRGGDDFSQPPTNVPVNPHRKFRNISMASN